MSSERHLLIKIKNRYLFQRGLETVMLAIGISILVFAITNFFSASSVLSLTLSIGFAIAIIIYRVVSLNLYRFHESRIATYLNHYYPQLESSTDLLLHNTNELSTLQHLQKSQVLQKLQSLEREIRFPNHLLAASVILLVGLSIGFAASRYGKSVSFNQQSEKKSSSLPSSPEKNETTVTTLDKINVTVNPPSYTRASTSSSSHLPLKIIEGSSVKWEFKFNGTPVDLSLIFSGKDSVRLPSKKDSYSFQRTFIDGGFYQYTWKDQSNTTHQSDYYPIEVIKDEAPRIVVDNLAQFIELNLTDKLVVNLKTTLSDDFGLKDAHIIATVSKGSGESVKFREETLRFFTPTRFSGKLQQANRSIDLVKLGLEPGDELYFYIEAFDNKQPLTNKSRTETFFIALKDTATYEMTEDQGLGVDLMPEYFRSQRQIIIDSEKILAERKEKKISKEDFNSKSNELGYDQKVLRLRYGQFMGEEAESGIAQATLPTEEDADEKVEDVMKKFGHAHDTENEHNLVGDKKQGSKEDHHDHGSKQESEAEDKNPMAAFTHSHDNADEATFFEQSIKTKLKAALTLMWDAELHLRMYQPDQSLAYQYKILKLLKEISNDSRVYVHRSGFDPPPLKEEKRLSGDLSELTTSFSKNDSKETFSFPGIRKSLITIETLLQKQNPVITPAAQAAFQKAGNELAGVAIREPGAYLKTLSLLKSLNTNELQQDEIRQALIAIRKSFWKVLPAEVASPAAKQNTSHPLDIQFLKQFEALKHER